MTKKIKNNGTKNNNLIISAKGGYQHFKTLWNQLYKDKAAVSAVCDFYGVCKGGFFGISRDQLCRKIYAKAKTIELEIEQPNH